VANTTRRMGGRTCVKTDIGRGENHRSYQRWDQQVGRKKKKEETLEYWRIAFYDLEKKKRASIFQVMKIVERYSPGDESGIMKCLIFQAEGGKGWGEKGV